MYKKSLKTNISTYLWWFFFSFEIGWIGKHCDIL